MDHIIQAIEAMAGLEEKAEKLVRIADIINNTMADAETGTLLAGEGYCMNIATQFYEVAEMLRFILYDALPQWFHSIQCNLVNELITCQGQEQLAIDNHIQGLQELFAHTNQFLSIPKVISRIPPKENKTEEEEVILICPSSPLSDDKSTTVSSNDESMISATENPNNQIIEEINNLIAFLKQFKAPNNVVCFLPPAGYCTISRNRENSSRYWNWIIKELIKSKQNSETVWREFKILLYAKGPPHEPWFIAEAPDKGYIVGLQKKSVAIYAMCKGALGGIPEHAQL